MSFFDRFRRIAPASAPASALERAARAIEARKYDEAESHLDAAYGEAADERARALVFNKRAVVAICRGDAAGGAQQLAAALAEYPACVPALVNVANQLLEAGEVVAAIERYQAAIALDPDYPEAHYNLGVAYKRQGKRRDAVRSLRRATGLETRRQKNT